MYAVDSIIICWHRTLLIRYLRAINDLTVKKTNMLR